MPKAQLIVSHLHKKQKKQKIKNHKKAEDGTLFLLQYIHLYSLFLHYSGH